MKSKSFFNSKIFAVNILLVLLSASCRLEVPIKEMTVAKSTITRAVEVKSEKYAPEELKKAKDELIKSHDAMKTEDVKAAKKSAEESIKYSNDAIEKSLPLLADDNLKVARSIFEEANIAFAEKYASEEYSLAGTKIGEAEILFSDKQYWDSYLKSEEAITHATNARDKAISNMSSLEDRIKSIDEEAKKLEAMGSREFAPEEMNAIDAGLADGRQLLEKKNVKDASGKIVEADAALKEASLKTWKGYAAAKIKAAEEAMQKLTASPLKDQYTKDLQKADMLVNESKELYNKDAFNESSIKSEEALGILNSIAIAMEKTAEGGKIDEGTQTLTGKPGDSKAGAATEYIVKYNPKNRDCLWRIAMYVYKDARLWPIIYVANKDYIKDPDLIFPGQKLVVPAVPAMEDLNKIKNDDSSKTEEILPEKTNTQELEKKEELQQEQGKENEIIKQTEENIEEKGDETLNLSNDKPDNKSESGESDKSNEEIPETIK